MKEKKHCLSCKKKPENQVTNLQTYDEDLLLEAGEYLQRITEMTPDKWDVVEDIYLQIYPTGNRLNRTCGDCLRNVTRAVLYEYNKLKNKTSK